MPRRFVFFARDRVRALLHALGPGLITGAADDDPSGIATYSQAGAQYGFSLVWVTLASTPFMIAIQMAAARIGRVTGMGIAGNLRAFYPRPLVFLVVALLVAANTINIAADIAAMGESLQLILDRGEHFHAAVFGVLLAWLQLWLPYQRLAAILKWLCLSLLAYVVVLFLVHLDLTALGRALIAPQWLPSADSVSMVVAILGTTISPYLFFWQAGQEVEEMRRKSEPPLLQDAQLAGGALLRIRVDTVTGMSFSNAIALAIMLAAGATLHSVGVHDITTATQAAEALRPLAGDQAYVLFAAGIIATGLLAVPVLAGSAAYAVSELMDWEHGLDKRFKEARGFYAILLGATLAGTLLDFTPIDMVKALLFSAVINGVVAVPLMAMIVLLAANRRALGAFVISRRLQVLGWVITLLMAAAVALMLTGGVGGLSVF